MIARAMAIQTGRQREQGGGRDQRHEMIERRAGRVVDGLIAGEPFGRAAHHSHHAERHDKWRHAKAGDHQAVDQANCTAGQHGQRHRGGGGIALHEQGRSQHARKGHRRADAQINSAADNDHRHAQRPDGHNHGLCQNDFKIAASVKIGAHFGVERKEAEHDEQAEERPDDVYEAEKVEGFVWAGFVHG